MASITASRISATEAASGTASSHPYTCNTCQVAFRNSDLQRGHMRSDWHRYNLKRRVTSLPPITSEVFAEKVLQAQATSTAAASKAAYEKTCVACARSYFSQNAYHNHIGSQKHKARVSAEQKKQPLDDETSSVMSSTFSLGDPVHLAEELSSEDEQDVNRLAEKITKTDLNAPADTKSETTESTTGEKASLETISKHCLFCNYESPSVELNAAHMERHHSMFIPEKQYLVDLTGLIASLHDRVFELHECLWCAKLNPTVFGLQTHMRDKGHCKIRFDSEEDQLEIGEFYDFRSTYSDEDSEFASDEDGDDSPKEKRAVGAKLGARRDAKMEGGDNEGDGWETDSSASSLDSADLTAVPLDQRFHSYEKLDQHPHHAHADPRPHHNKDGWHSHAHKHTHAAFYTDYELHLPSGRTAGHRSLNRYYRQNLHSHPSPAERQEMQAIEDAAGSDSDVEMDDRVARRSEGERGRAITSRANGGLGMMGVTAEKKREVLAAEKRSRKVEEREKRKFQWGNNKQNNNQKHFRDPLLQ